MRKRTALALRWIPRIAGIGLAVFLSGFAVDAFGEGKTVFQALPAFAVHLIPAFAVLAAVALSWRFPPVGAVAFIGLALAYAIGVRWRLDWIAVIALPLVVIALLFAASSYCRVLPAPTD